MEKQNQALTTSSERRLSVFTPTFLACARLDTKQYPRYGTLPQNERQKWLAKMFLTLATITRVKDYNAKDASVGAVALDEKISSSPVLSDLTLPEIEGAFKTGIFGDYGEYYGLTAISLYGFLDKYVKSDKKAEISKIVREAREREIADEDEAYRARIRAEVEEAKRNGSFVPTGRFNFGRVGQSVDDAIDSTEHRARIQKQAQDILAGRIKF